MFQETILKSYGQAEMPECDDQASKHQCFKKMKTTVSEDITTRDVSVRPFIFFTYYNSSLMWLVETFFLHSL